MSAHRGTLASFVPLLVLTAACGGGSPTGPSPGGAPLLTLSESAAYVFKASRGDTIDTAWQERYHAWAIQALGVTPRQRIVYNKYTGRAHMGEVAGVGNTNAFANPTTYEIHTIWPTDNHEVVHLYTSTWGQAVALINEGVAVAYQIDPARDLVPRWSSTPLHDLARQFRADGRFVPLTRIVETTQWRSYDANVMYPLSGSFVRWLIDTHGLEKLRALIAAGGGGNEPAASVLASIERIYGRPLAQLEGDWVLFLQAR